MPERNVTVYNTKKILDSHANITETDAMETRGRKRIKKGEDSEVLHVRIPQSMMTALEDLARYFEFDKSDMTRELLEEGIRRRNVEWVRCELAGDDEALKRAQEDLRTFVDASHAKRWLSDLLIGKGSATPPGRRA
jgi:hypothetical protein